MRCYFFARGRTHDGIQITNDYKAGIFRVGSKSSGVVSLDSENPADSDRKEYDGRVKFRSVVCADIILKKFESLDGKQSELLTLAKEKKSRPDHKDGCILYVITKGSGPGWVNLGGIEQLSGPTAIILKEGMDHQFGGYNRWNEYLLLLKIGAVIRISEAGSKKSFVVTVENNLLKVDPWDRYGKVTEKILTADLF